jgi:predicted metal-dependent peptidase
MSDKLSQILYRIISRERHMIGPLAYMKKVENPQLEVPTRLNGEVIEYNADDLLKMDEDCVPQMLGEVVHMSLMHPERKRMMTGGMQQYELVADLAADLATYHNLTDSKAFVRPSDLKFPEGKSFEEYFNMLMDKINKMGISLMPGPDSDDDQGDDSDDSGSGSGSKLDDDSDDNDGQGQASRPKLKNKSKQTQAKDPMQELLKQLGVNRRIPTQDHSQWGSVPLSAQQLAQTMLLNALDRQRGDLPGDLRRLLEQIEIAMKPKWYQKLRNLIGNKMVMQQKRSTMKRPSRRLGIPYPGKKRIRRGSIVVSIDTSGSISDHELAIFLHDVKEICTVYQAPFHIIACDADVHQVERISNEADIKKFVKNLKGGGGTSHVPVFEYIEEHKLNPDLYIAFTDGETDWPKEPPPYKMIWALVGDYGKHPEQFKVPYGEKFGIENLS